MSAPVPFEMPGKWVPAHDEVIFKADFETSNPFTSNMPDFSYSPSIGLDGSAGLGREVENTAHRHTYDPTVLYGPDDDVTYSAWIRLTSGPSIALAGLNLASKFQSSGYQVLIDVRRGSNSTAGMQIRKDAQLVTDGLAAVNPLGNAPVRNVWYRLEAEWRATGPTITARLFDQSGRRLAVLEYTDPSASYSVGGFGMYAYGMAFGDDFTVTRHVPDTYVPGPVIDVYPQPVSLSSSTASAQLPSSTVSVSRREAS